ncbi:MAG: T9SS type A sorting domain-containing protein, partial [Bacteroides sp.]|nr:T9SS type A sorting domain-containing protein [Bacteroides sp.]
QSGIRIYDLQGVCHYNDANASEVRVALPAGMYIVCSGAAAKKVRL